MKKLLSMLLIVGSLLLVSCSSDSPKTVAEKFAKAMSEADYKTAIKYADKQTAQLLEMTQKMLEASPESAAQAKEQAKEGFKDFTITKVDEKGDTAKVFFKTAAGEDSFDLKKEDGKWVVAMNKEGGAGM